MKKRKTLFYTLLAALLASALGGCGQYAAMESEARPTAEPSESAESTIVPEHEPVFGYSNATIVESVYSSEDVIIADIVITKENYGADASGKEDSTQAIQKALQDCADSGGGTVWLPAGHYRITGPIKIPAFVTLRGDWQDPDLGNHYGTVLLMDIPETHPDDKTGSIYIGGSAGAVGLTVYYPHQSIEHIRPYPFTFYVTGQHNAFMLQNISHCTLINSYKGIGACVAERNAHEMLTVNTLKGTVLSRGAVVYNQADVGTWTDVTLNTRYWENAPEGMRAADGEALKKYTRANTIGFQLGDLEWTQFRGIHLSDMSVGVNLVRGKRISFAGTFYNLIVQRCTTALYAENMDHRWGTLIAQSRLSGDTAINNISLGTIRLSGVETDGPCYGSIESDAELFHGEAPVRKRPGAKPRNLIVLKADISGYVDCSRLLQEATEKVHGMGGGIVYLPAGIYRLEKPVSVPENVELRGCSGVMQREQPANSSGTLVLAYGTKYRTAEEAAAAEATVTLSGRNAGVRGIRFMVPDVINGCSQEEKAMPQPYVIRGTADGVYAINTAITGGYLGIDFSGCHHHLIQGVVGCCLKNMITVGGKNGSVENILQNCTAMTRMGVSPDLVTPVDEQTQLFPVVFDGITRRQSEIIRISPDAEGQTIINAFAYGGKHLIVNSGKDTEAINIGADNLGSESPMILALQGNLSVINQMRYNGISYRCDGGSVIIHNRLSIGQKKEAQSAEAHP